MRTLFFHHYTEKGKVFHGKLDTRIIREAITLHPIKQPEYMHRLHVHFMNSKIELLQHKAVELQRILRNMDRLIKADEKRLVPQEKNSLQNIKDQLAKNYSEQWDMFTANSYYFDVKLRSPGTGIRGALKIELTHLLESTIDHLKEESRRTSHAGNKNVHKIKHGYRRVHPIYGVQYVLQLTVKTQRKIRDHKLKKTRTISTLNDRVFHSQRPLGNVLYRAEPVYDMSPYVHFLVPLEGRLETFRRFMNNFEQVCLKPLLRVKLLVAYSSSVSSPDEHKAVLKEYQDKYPLAGLTWLDVPGNFSRGIAMMLAADQYERTALLFLCDVDLIFSKEFIDRCRMNTALGKHVFYPIMYSQFDPKLSHTSNNKPDTYYNINEGGGIWRTYSYGPACMYGQDMHAVGGFDTSIKGWGWEDVDLYQKFINHTEYEVLRAADPGLIHIYHPVNCDPNLPDRQMTLCQGSKASGIANQKELLEAMLSVSTQKHNNS